MEERNAGLLRDRKSKGVVQGVLFLTGIICAAALCAVIACHMLEMAGFIRLPDWIR